MPPQLNPHEANPPDYHTERYAPARQRIVDALNITQEDAAMHLLMVWQAQNQIDRQDWDERIAQEAEQFRIEQERQQREAAEAERIKHLEEEEARKEERKKNRAKFLPFADVPPPSTIPIIPSPIALRKLRKGDYVPLYFFTNKGLADAQAASQSFDDEAMAFIPDEQGVQTLVPVSAAKTKQSVIQDQDLTWAQLDEATHRMLKAMTEADWPEERSNAMLHFWLNLGAHPWRHDADESARQALIIYQATYRRRWHDTLGTPSSFNPKHIDQDALIQIKAKIVDQKYQATEKRAKEASPLPFRLTIKKLTTPLLVALPHRPLSFLPSFTTSYLHYILRASRPPHWTPDRYLHGPSMYAAATRARTTVFHLPHPTCPRLACTARASFRQRTNCWPQSPLFKLAKTLLRCPPTDFPA